MRANPMYSIVEVVPAQSGEAERLREVATLTLQFVERLAAYRAGTVSLTGIEQDARHLALLARAALTPPPPEREGPK